MCTFHCFDTKKNDMTFDNFWERRSSNFTIIIDWQDGQVDIFPRRLGEFLNKNVAIQLIVSIISGHA